MALDKESLPFFWPLQMVLLIHGTFYILKDKSVSIFVERIGCRRRFLVGERKKPNAMIQELVTSLESQRHSLADPESGLLKQVPRGAATLQ